LTADITLTAADVGAMAAAKMETVSVSLTADGWGSGDLTLPKVTSLADDIWLSPATTATAAQIAAWKAALVVGVSQAVGSVTLTCYGTAPAITIPVLIKIIHW
jgi:hypothetical protein